MHIQPLYAAASKFTPSHAQVDVHNNLGDLWRAQGQLGRIEAQNCYQEALRIQPLYAAAWRGLGDLYREVNDHQQAIAYYQEAVRLRPDFADAFTGMGVSLKVSRVVGTAELRGADVPVSAAPLLRLLAIACTSFPHGCCICTDKPATAGSAQYGCRRMSRIYPARNSVFPCESRWSSWS